LDEHLQRLKRADPGDRAARARVLQQRLRQGELDPARVALLAYLGDGAARQVAPDAPQPPETLEAWAEGLRTWGTEALLRALAAAMRATLPAAEAERRPCQTCGSYGQVQVRFGKTFDWEPCPDCGACDRCGRARRFGPDDLPCPDCVDLRGRVIVEALETWVHASERSEGLLNELLPRLGSILTAHDWGGTDRPALRQLCLIGLAPFQLTLAPDPNRPTLTPEGEIVAVLAPYVARHVLDLNQVAQPRGCVGDAIVDALHAWADA
jgi:hypothetical protein